MKIQAPIRATRRSNRYCGPAVISSLTGTDTAETAAVIRAVTGKKQVTGTTPGQLLESLEAYNIGWSNLFVEGKPTLAAWLRENKELRAPGRVFLVLAGYHCFLISGRRYVCGRIGDVVSIRDKRVKRRARVIGVYSLVQKGPIKLSDEVRRKLDNVEACKAPKPPSGWRERARKLGLRVEQEYREGHEVVYWIFPGSSWACDPIDDGHYAVGAHEAAGIVETYADAEATHRRAAA